jgi:hypothetical protein
MEPVAQVDIVMEFIDILHRALSSEQLEDPDDVKKLYEKIHRQLVRRHKMDLKKATINRVYTLLVKQACFWNLGSRSVMANTCRLEGTDSQ